MTARAALLAVAVAVGLGACQRADEEAAETGATTLTVYASLPLQGPDGRESEAVANGERLALREAGGKAGELVVKLVVLDSSTPSSGGWNREQTGENARRVVRDRTAIAYLGDGPSDATAISLPILNSAGVLQVSPTSGYRGFTRRAGKGEPERFYPSGKRTFARPVPADDVEARALLAQLRDADCERVQLLEDGGLGLAGALEEAAGVEVVGRSVLRSEGDVAGVVAEAVARRADCAVWTGALTAWVPGLFDALHRADPALELLGARDLATPTFAGALAAGTQARTRLVAPAGVLESTPQVRDFARRYRAAFGSAPRSGALYGYEAMRLVLAAIAKAGPRGDNRTFVARALFALGERPSPLGPYRLDAGGDTTSTAFSVLRVTDGRLERRRTASFAPD